MKKSLSLIAILFGFFISGQASVFAVTVNDTVNLMVNCDDDCANEGIIIKKYK
jgi:hypothetical protein